MKKILLSLSLATLTAFGLFAVSGYFAGPVAAVDDNTGSGQALEIAPPVLTLRADPGETINTQISIRDISPTALRVTSEVNDFSSEGREDGAPVLRGVDEEEPVEPSPYSIVSWVEPLPPLLLEPREIENLPVRINVPADAAPGGYYGVVRFTATPASLDSTGVALSASIGSLVFIRVNGDAKQAMEIVEFSTSKNGKPGWFFDSTPIDFVQRVKNTGNVHEQPVSSILVKDMFGNNVVNLNMNLEQRNVLPDSIRRFTSPLDSSAIGDRVLFGRYSATITTKYGENGAIEVTDTLSFWVVPWQIILGIIALIIAIVLGFRFWLSKRDQKLSHQRYRRR